MNLTTSHRLNRSLALVGGAGLALVGGAGLALGGNAALAAPATTQHLTQPVAAVLSLTATPKSAPATVTPRLASTQGPVTWAQAATLAARQTHATVDKVEATTGPSGTEYEVKLNRADGSDLEVTVLGRTGQVVAARQQDAPDAQQQDAPDAQHEAPDAPEAPKAPEAADAPDAQHEAPGN